MTLESGSEIKSGTIPINALGEGFKLSERDMIYFDYGTDLLKRTSH
jgi:hypothetical protein